MNFTCKEHKHFNLCKKFQSQRTRSHALSIVWPIGTADTMAKQNQALKEIPALLKARDQ